MSDSLPPEILFKIFLTLPSKTLRRLLSVSKSWHALITSKPFVSSHLIQNPNKENNSFFLLNLLKIHTQILKYHTWDNHEQFSFYPQNKETTHSSLGMPSDTMYPPLVGKPGTNRVVGISNGLICLFKNLYHKFNAEPILWNPAIDMFVKLPTPGISRIYPDMYAFGFWFDSKTSDYKVMRIVYRSNKEVVENYDLPPLAEVYSLSTREWRRINVDGVRCYMPYSSWSHAYVNGRSHWIGCRYHPYRCLIMSFDMNDEVVCEILLPTDLALMTASNVMITERMGCLAVIGDDLGLGFCRVWVMEEYGVFHSWTNLFNMAIDIVPMYYKFVGFWQNGDVLMMRNGYRLALYSPESKSAVDLDIGEKYSTYAGIYEESLALLDLKFSDEWMDEIETKLNSAIHMNSKGVDF